MRSDSMIYRGSHAADAAVSRLAGRWGILIRQETLHLEGDCVVSLKVTENLPDSQLMMCHLSVWGCMCQDDCLRVFVCISICNFFCHDLPRDFLSRHFLDVLAAHVTTGQHV